jgi:hypothetical protein
MMVLLGILAGGAPLYGEPMKETPMRRITVTSSLNEIFTDQLGNGGGGGGGGGGVTPPAPIPLYGSKICY